MVSSADGECPRERQMVGRAAFHAEPLRRPRRASAWRTLEATKMSRRGERRTDPIQTAKHVGFAVEIVTGSHVTAPTAVHDGDRRVGAIRGTLFELQQIVKEPGAPDFPRIWFANVCRKS